MTVTLPKGGNLFLRDEAPGVEQVRIGLGWSQQRQAPGSAAVEMEGLVSLIGESSPSGRLLLAHQVPNPDESVAAPLASGRVVGDAEKLVVTLAAVPAAVSRLLFGAAIYDAAQARQSFRSVRGAYIRVVNQANGVEIVRYTLGPETGTETAMVFGELYRNLRGWKFRAVGQGYVAGLRGVAGAAAGEPQIARPVEVAGYLRRTSPARSHRSVAEHLDPPKRAVPAPPPSSPAPPSAPPAPSSSPQRRSPAKAAPKRARPEPAPPTSRPPRQPARQATPPPAATRSAPPAAASRPAAPPPASPRRRAARSSLDLGGPDESPATGGTDSGTTAPPPAAAGRSPARLVFGEHSSRYRQRMEHVAALDDDHPVTTWTEDAIGAGGMTVTLRWEPLQTASGLPRPSDLQLGCFWQADDRSAGVMQTLGGAISAPGALGPRQVLRLGRRDEHEGQKIFVDVAALQTFRRFFVFAYGQHGSPPWAQLRPALSIAAPSGEGLAMRLGEAPPSARLCIVASFHLAAGDLIIRRENDYLEGSLADAAARYGWTFEWNPDGMSLRDAR